MDGKNFSIRLIDPITNFPGNRTAVIELINDDEWPSIFFLMHVKREVIITGS
jgi:hypothetical protein